MDDERLSTTSRPDDDETVSGVDDDKTIICTDDAYRDPSIPLPTPPQNVLSTNSLSVSAGSIDSGYSSLHSQDMIQDKALAKKRAQARGIPVKLGGRNFFRFNTLDKPKQAHLNDVIDRIEPLLLARLRNTRVRHGLMGFETMMLGKTEERGHEHIIVCCRSQIAETVESFFEKNKIIKELCGSSDDQTPAITILVHGQEPQLIAKLLRSLIYMAHTTDNFEAPWSTEPRNIKRPTLCGSSLKLTSSQRVLKAATGGGMIKVVSKAGQSMLYGMTAGHVFSEETPTSSEEASLVNIERVGPRAFSYRWNEQYGLGGLDPASKVWKRGGTEEKGPDFDWALLESKDLLEFGANRCRLKNSSTIDGVSFLTTEIGTFSGDEIYKEVEMIANTKFCRPGVLSGAPARILFEAADAFTPAYMLELSGGPGKSS
ncbi:hypothetical protein CLIM01_00155 [Colletotrichum limetticola]|uniref:Uncharacterized protein n=1 Tax=Colletotrichum limetticola TaxID=1209924 RepID=A0ABQ9QF74_9PEZI|nr:hypothetical protein CLIM01_00155 [Colletotrichum limetticola]